MTTAKLTAKITSIATIRYLCRTCATFPTPLGSHYRLPLTEKRWLRGDLGSSWRNLRQYLLKPNSRTYNFIEVSGHILKFSEERFRYTMFTSPTRGKILERNPDKNLKEFSSLLNTVISIYLPRDFYFFKLTQPLTYSVKLLYTVKEKGGNPERKSYRGGGGYPQRNCTFMNSWYETDIRPDRRQTDTRKQQWEWQK